MTQQPRPGDRTAAWTALLAVLVATSSLLGLLVPAVYARETDEWALQARGQDLGNLIAVVVLVVSGRRWVGGSRAAGSVWLGTLFYLGYAFAVYAFAVHFNRLFPVYVAVLGLSVYAALDRADALRSSGPPVLGARRLVAGTLIGTGTVFALLWLSEIVPAVITGDPLPSLAETGLVVNPIHVLDLSVVLPGLVLTGWSVLRDRPQGRFLAGPWLVFSVLMGTSIVVTTGLLLAAGDPGAIVPMVGVGAVVLVSRVALLAALRVVPSGSAPDRTWTGPPSRR